MAKLSEILRERGYAYQQSSDTLEEVTDGQKRVMYYGIDPSADSLHVGQLMTFLVLRRFVEDGHKLILLVGGGTGMIGDPGGKSVERPLLEAEVVRANAQKIGEQVKKLLGGYDLTIVNNADWLIELRVVDFLRDVGKHFSVNAMLSKDFIKDRVKNKDEGISYTEFSYSLLQSYDFYHLHKEYACDLQVGGSDQWGNIISGVDFIRRKTGDVVYAFTWPLLINKTTGKKFGKSEQGTIWLDPLKTSPYQFYQFWINTPDEALEEYLMRMTTLSQVEIGAALELHRRNRGERQGQLILAREATTLVHGEKAAVAARAVSDILFGDKDLTSVDPDVLDMLRTEAPSLHVHAGDSIVDVLVSSGLATSKRDARQLIENGGASLGSNAISAIDRTLSSEDFENGLVILSRGARTVCVLIQQ